MGNLSVWENIAVDMFIYFLLSFLYNLGRKIIILDLTIIMAALTCLLMPVIFYHNYTQADFLARIWVKYMPIPSDDYFSFTVPAVLALYLGLNLPLGRSKVYANPEDYIKNVKIYLSTRPRLGITLIIIGFASGLLNVLVPGNLKQVFYLLAHLTHVGVFYTLYSPGKNKRIAVPAVLLLVLGQSVMTGMFGELIFMLATSLVLLLLGTHISFTKKLTFAIAGIFLIVVLQSVKQEYRKKIWNETGSGDAFYFSQLISDRVSDPSVLLNRDALFTSAVRMNQGWLVAMTMARVPEKFSFAYGETIGLSVAAAIVPRFMWADKPETGGKANLKRFWGFDLVGFSTNIGILGEAYANFDRVGGIIYMFFYGLFFNFVLMTILRLSTKTPSLVLWIPYFFFNAIAVETDLLSTMGALMKSIMFAALVFWAFKRFYKINL